MEEHKPIVNIKINLSELKALAEAIIRHAPVILAQKDPRVSEKTQNRAGAYPNIKDHPTHEQVLTLKIKELLDKVLDTPLSDEDYATFLTNLIQRALNQ